MITNGSTFHPEDVTLLLNDITGIIQPKSTEEREKLIQTGIHYSEMLPIEYKPSEKYLNEYYRALDNFAYETSAAVAAVSQKIYQEKGPGTILVSLARAGTPIGVLIKRYLRKYYSIDAPHYTISIVRGRGIDKTAMRHIINLHPAKNIQFLDGWTGKGAILDELSEAAKEFTGDQNTRQLLAVLADPANITDICGTHEDIPIASSFLNSTVCGLISRTVILPNLPPNELHGVAINHDLRPHDRTYEFIDKIESHFENANMNTPNQKQTDHAQDTFKGIDEVREIAKKYNIADINYIKPGIGEATRVLLRRIPETIIISETAQPRHIAHLIQLAQEKQVPITHLPLRRYKACGIIKTLTPDL